MDDKKKFVIITVILVVLLIGTYVLYTQLSQQVAPDQLSTQGTQPQDAESDSTGAQQTQPEKATAPDFVVYDAEGKEVRLSDYFGKPIVLNFWASWCGPCKMEMPDFHDKYLEMGERVQFLMINMTDGSRETVDTASAFIAQNAYTFPVFFDTKSHAATVYGAYSLPTTYFIDAEGNAVARATGAIDEKTLQRGIDMITP